MKEVELRVGKDDTDDLEYLAQYCMF